MRMRLKKRRIKMERKRAYLGIKGATLEMKQCRSESAMVASRGSNKKIRWLRHQYTFFFEFLVFYISNRFGLLKWAESVT